MKAKALLQDAPFNLEPVRQESLKCGHLEIRTYCYIIWNTPEVNLDTPLIKTPS